MIARILYRENVQGVLKYVLGKTKSTVLCFGNTYSESNTDPKLFSNILYHLGQRSGSEKRYVHISLNLPHGERLRDKDFSRLSKNYMEHMGYGGQPFMVVRHHDTKHQHVHIVSTTIQEDGTQINLSNDYRRNMATQKYLEQEFGLSPSPSAKEQKELPLYQTPQLKKDDTNGVKYYIQDILNNTLQKYNVRGFQELAELVKPHHIMVRPIQLSKGRVGVSYGISIENGYKSRFIDGNIVHPKLSGPKLKRVFEKNANSKLLPMAKKRLEKQLRTTYKLFKTINLEHFPDILRSYQKLDCKVDYDDQRKAIDFRIYDKSGYVLRIKEIANDIGILQNPGLFQGERTQMYMESEQLTLELQKCIKEVFQTTYRNSRSKVLFSEHIDGMPTRMVLDEMVKSERFMFLKKYLSTDNINLVKLINEQFPETRNKLQIKEAVREERQLNEKAELIKTIIGSPLFDLKSKKGVLLEFLESVGVRYGGRTIRHVNSYRHKVQLNLGNLELPDRIGFYASPGFVRENEKVLDGLLNNKTEKEIGLGPNAFFLPLMFPNLYESMGQEYRQKFERLSLKAYQKHAERRHVSFEKSPKDYIRYFNAKGFYFKKKEGHIHISSVYSKNLVSIKLTPKKEVYLNTTSNLETVLENQSGIIDNIKNQGQGHLKNLWASHLIERKQYKKAAFMIVVEGIRPNLSKEILNFHMENGLRQEVLSRAKQQINAKQLSLLRKIVYAATAILGRNKTKQEEVFNGFKDELTDYSKYKGRGI